MKALLWFMPLFLLACGQNKSEFYYDNHPVDALYRTWDPKAFPLLIQVPQEMEEYQVSIDRAAEAWNLALGQRVVVFVYNRTSNTQWEDAKSSLYDSTLGLYKQINWGFEDIGPGVLAYTGTLSLDGTIQQADLIFNFDNFSFADVDSPPLTTNYVDFESVLIHELGHFLGLGHVTTSEDSASVMLPSIRKAEGRRDLSQGDLYRIRNLYFKL